MGVQTLEGDYKEMALLRALRREAQAAIHSQQSEHRRRSYNIIKHSIYYYSQSRPSYIYVTKRYMSGRHLTQSEYALQQVVELFGNLLIQLEEPHLTHTYQTVFRFCQLEKIDYLMLRYLNTGALPFQEWAEEWLYDREV
jgi:hypothetical protein